MVATERQVLSGRLLELLEPPAEGLLADYFDLEGPFAADTFDTFEVTHPDQVLASDLLAVTMLDVRIRPLALRQILGRSAQELSNGLRLLPTDLDLWEASDDQLAELDRLDDLLRRPCHPGLGPVVASKLLSRKRPRLAPIPFS